MEFKSSQTHKFWSTGLYDYIFRWEISLLWVNQIRLHLTFIFSEIEIQLWTFENEVNLRGQNIPLIYCYHAELVMYIWRGYESFHTVNMGSVSQTAEKLLSVKLWEWFWSSWSRPWADWFELGRVADLFWDLQLWQLVTLKPLDQKIPNFQYWKI